MQRTSDKSTSEQVRPVVTGNASPYAPQLDGLRATAVLIVIASHTGFGVIPGGFGVTIFFFLSGYLITTLLRIEQLKTGRVDLGSFYARRMLRILPPLYVTIAFALVLYRFGLLSVEIDWRSVLSQSLFLENYSGFWGASKILPIMLWSLAVEEHFYIVFPLCFRRWLARLDPKRAAAACAWACLLPLLFRILNVYLLREHTGYNYVLTHTRADAILFGCCLALWRNPLIDADAYEPKPHHLLAALAVLLACFVVREQMFRDTLRYTLQSAALYVVFAYCLSRRGVVSRLLSSGLLKRVALYSYTLYLSNLLFLDPALQRATAVPGVPRLLSSLIMMTLYADLMHRFVERTTARLRRKLHTKRMRHTVLDSASSERSFGKSPQGESL